MNYQRLSKNALGCMYLSAVVGMLVKMVILSAVYLLFFQDNKIALIFYGALMGISLLSCVFKPYFKYYFYKYSIDDESIDIVQGFIIRRRNVVPIERLHKLDINRGPFLRLFGLSDITVYTAGGEVNFEYIKADRAEEILNMLRKKINEVAIQQKIEEKELDNVIGGE